jgi:hypothetical protein
MATVHLGIDVGARQLFAVVIDEPTGTVTSEGALTPGQLPSLLQRLQPESVAIDAPNGLSRVGGRRAAETELGIGGCYATPSDRTLLPPWMETGLVAHEKSAALLNEGVPHPDGQGRVFEVHPTYGFKSLLGLRVSPGRVIVDPSKLLVSKRMARGREQRLAVLVALAERLSLNIDAILPECRNSIDIADASMAAMLSVLRQCRLTRAVGDPTEGVIIVADVPEDDVLRMQNAAGTASAPPTPRAPRRRQWSCSGNGALLRLGEHGPGGRTPEDSRREIEAQLEAEGHVVLPLSKPAVGDWGERARLEGFSLVVAVRGVPVSELHVVDICPAKEESVSDRDCWRGAAEARWLIVADGGRRLDGTLAELLQTSTKDRWVDGLPDPPGQNAWRCFRWRMSMLPPFNERGDLPAGIHRATLQEIDERFGSGEARRRLVGTLRHLYRLAEQTGYLERFLIFGSFVTNKEMPGDVDVVLVMGETFKLEEAPRESRTLFSHADADARFGASVFWIRRGILPDEEVARLLEFWQSRRDGETRGIVEVTHDQK